MGLFTMRICEFSISGRKRGQARASALLPVRVHLRIQVPGTYASVWSVVYMMLYTFLCCLSYGLLDRIIGEIDGSVPSPLESVKARLHSCKHYTVRIESGATYHMHAYLPNCMLADMPVNGTCESDRHHAWM